MRTITVAMAALILGACAAGAQQSEARFAVRGGFYLGNGFSDGLLHTHLEGFEIGADVPIVRKASGVNGIYFAPTVVFGGSNRSGPDTDGNIYRLMVNAKRDFGTSGFYGGLGLGVSFTQARTFTGAGAATGRPGNNSEFVDVAGVTGEFLLGYVLNYRSGARTKPFLELSYYAGSDEKLSGLSVNVGSRL